MSSLTLAAETFARINPSSITAFREHLGGRLLTPLDEGYNEARQIWNAMIDKRPALIAQCTSTTDVQHAVTFAREHGLAVSIRGGGHNIAGAALCDGGLMIDRESAATHQPADTAGYGHEKQYLSSPGN